jgi:hypothetical protein
MPDHIIRTPEPEETDEEVSMELRPGPGTCGDAVMEDLAALAELTAAGVELDGEVQVTESTWVIYGHTSYDGEVIVGEYHDATEASEVLRAVPRRSPGDESST